MCPWAQIPGGPKAGEWGGGFLGPPPHCLGKGCHNHGPWSQIWVQILTMPLQAVWLGASILISLNFFICLKKQRRREGRREGRVPSEIWFVLNLKVIMFYICRLALIVHYKLRCCCSVAHSCPTLCDPMDCSTPGFPVLHHLPKFAQTHVHRVSNAIQPCHSSPAFGLSKHRGLFQWVGSPNQVAKVLELQHQPFQWIFRVDFYKLN